MNIILPIVAIVIVLVYGLITARTIKLKDSLIKILQDEISTAKIRLNKSDRDIRELIKERNNCYLAISNQNDTELELTKTNIHLLADLKKWEPLSEMIAGLTIKTRTKTIPEKGVKAIRLLNEAVKVIDTCLNDKGPKAVTVTNKKGKRVLEIYNNPKHKKSKS